MFRLRQFAVLFLPVLCTAFNPTPFLFPARASNLNQGYLRSFLHDGLLIFYFMEFCCSWSEGFHLVEEKHVSGGSAIIWRGFLHHVCIRSYVFRKADL